MTGEEPCLGAGGANWSLWAGAELTTNTQTHTLSCVVAAVRQSDIVLAVQFLYLS